MNDALYQRLKQFAENVSNMQHRSELLAQLAHWQPVRQQSFSLPAAGSEARLSQERIGQFSSPQANIWDSPAPQQAAAPAPLPAPAPKPAPVKSQEACIKLLTAGDAEAIDILTDTYGWESFDITRTLVAIGPRGGDHLFVLPNDAEFVMGAIDALLATMLFDHTPGQVSYRCDRACRVERSGFAVERLKDAEYWRTRQLTRGNLVH